MRKKKAEIKRKVAGIVAFLLAIIMILSSVSFIFVGNAGAAELNTTGGYTYETR